MVAAHCKKFAQSPQLLPVHSFRTMLADLATLARNTVRLASAHTMALLATPTQIHQRAFDLLGIKPQL